MSATVSFPGQEQPRTSAGLTPVPPARSTVSTVGFGLIIMALVALGMGLVMIVTTSVASQSKELSALRVEATELQYRAANLTTQLQEKSSSASLVIRASDAGMVPNPNPVFIRLSDGEILGDATPVVGDEAPYLRRPSLALAADSEDAAATESTLPVAAGVDQ
ncbi:MAG: hypothetical protein ACTHWA_03155 [Arachnia sp.]